MHNIQKSSEYAEYNNKLERKLITFSTKDDIDTINLAMKKFVNFSHMDKLRSEVIPMINEFSELVAKIS
jgi:phosphoribosylaminoimidazole-succinocarboxamide synthase